MVESPLENEGSTGNSNLLVVGYKQLYADENGTSEKACYPREPVEDLYHVVMEPSVFGRR